MWVPAFARNGVAVNCDLEELGIQVTLQKAEAHTAAMPTHQSAEISHVLHPLTSRAPTQPIPTAVTRPLQEQHSALTLQVQDLLMALDSQEQEHPLVLHPQVWDQDSRREPLRGHLTSLLHPPSFHPIPLMGYILISRQRRTQPTARHRCSPVRLVLDSPHLPLNKQHCPLPREGSHQMGEAHPTGPRKWIEGQVEMGATPICRRRMGFLGIFMHFFSPAYLS